MPHLPLSDATFKVIVPNKYEAQQQLMHLQQEQTRCVTQMLLTYCYHLTV